MYLGNYLANHELLRRLKLSFYLYIRPFCAHLKWQPRLFLGNRETVSKRFHGVGWVKRAFFLIATFLLAARHCSCCLRWGLKQLVSTCSLKLPFRYLKTIFAFLVFPWDVTMYPIKTNSLPSHLYIQPPTQLLTFRHTHIWKLPGLHHDSTWSVSSNVLKSDRL